MGAPEWVPQSKDTGGEILRCCGYRASPIDLRSGFRLGRRRQKFVLLEKCDDRLAAQRTERVCSPLKPGHNLFMPILNFFLTDIALIYDIALLRSRFSPLSHGL